MVRHRHKRLAPRPTEPFEPPPGISEPRFWPWFDSLSEDQRRQINEARNGPDCLTVTMRIWQETQR